MADHGVAVAESAEGKSAPPGDQRVPLEILEDPWTPAFEVVQMAREVARTDRDGPALGAPLGVPRRFTAS